LRARTVSALLLVVIGAVLARGAAAWAGGRPRIEDIEQSLARDPSYRVRVSAALVLGKLGEPRSVPALLAALHDGHPAVRATAAASLGKISDPTSAGEVRAALGQAAQDGSTLVRHMAAGALRAIDRRAGADRAAGPLTFEVKPMGDRSHHAGPALRDHMRDFLTDQLRPLGDVSTSASVRGFVVDGVIKDLSLNASPDTVEVVCAVQLVVSRRPSGGVFLLTTGEAIVQRPRNQFRPQHRATMEIEALESAVRGASADLVQHLAQR
jgi:hypothetical protein